MVARLLISASQSAETGYHPSKKVSPGGPAVHPSQPTSGNGPPSLRESLSWWPACSSQSANQRKRVTIPSRFPSLVARPLISTSPPPSSQFAKISAKAPKMTACRTSSQSSRRVETHFCNPSPKKNPLCPESFHRESYFLLYMSEGTISLLHMIIKYHFRQYRLTRFCHRSKIITKIVEEN